MPPNGLEPGSCRRADTVVDVRAGYRFRHGVPDAGLVPGAQARNSVVSCPRPGSPLGSQCTNCGWVQRFHNARGAPGSKGKRAAASSVLT